MVLFVFLSVMGTQKRIYKRMTALMLGRLFSLLRLVSLVWIYK